SLSVRAAAHALSSADAATGRAAAAEPAAGGATADVRAAANAVVGTAHIVGAAERAAIGTADPGDRGRAATERAGGCGICRAQRAARDPERAVVERAQRAAICAGLGATADAGWLAAASLARSADRGAEAELGLDHHRLDLRSRARRSRRVSLE